ncbi:MAG: hypothetical protein FD146_941 [Anaerolineaceae bacterium]|nr:MAG: hypothetical protein FD146_941 [Anaerolineaceae bacterium]
MFKEYHLAITAQALRGRFSETALDAILFGNTRQDRPAGQIGHPEYHFDDNAFERSAAYIERNRTEVRAALERGDALPAWHAFGRLTHAAQDFYAHSDYVTLWLDRFPADGWPPADAIDPLDADLLAGPLRSGKIYWPLEPFSWIPALKRFVLPLLPRDSHAWMNLDWPERGPKFAYAYAAAVKRTAHEFDLTAQSLPPELLSRFMGRG